MTENEAIIELKAVMNEEFQTENQEEAYKLAIQALEEIQQYRAMEERLKKVYGECDGLLEVVVSGLERHEDTELPSCIFKSRLLTDENVDMWDEYRAIGTIEEFKALKEKCVAKKAEYKKMVYPSHKWKEENGKIDVWAYEAGYCNGPMCERCYYAFCEHCNPNGYEGECVVEDYICPSCRENVGYKQTHCKCGQKLDWSE